MAVGRFQTQYHYLQTLMPCTTGTYFPKGKSDFYSLFYSVYLAFSIHYFVFYWLYLDLSKKSILIF